MAEFQHKLFEINDLAHPFQTKPKNQSVLVIQCGTDPLDAQLDKAVQTLDQLMPNRLHTETVLAPTEATLQKRIDQLRTMHAQYALVVIIGNPSATRLTLSQTQSISWTEVAYQMLLPFEPQFILMLARPAEREWPVHTFFEAIPMLKEVYVSPVLEAKLQTDVLKFMVSYLMTPNLSEANREFSKQVADKLVESGTVIRWTWRASLKQRLLNTFEMLNEMEKLEVAAEIMSRTFKTARPIEQMQQDAEQAS